MTRNEIISLVIVGAAIVVMSLQVMIPPLRALDKSAIFLVSTILFFVLRILDIDDLELIPVEHRASFCRSDEHRVTVSGRPERPNGWRSTGWPCFKTPTGWSLCLEWPSSCLS